MKKRLLSVSIVMVFLTSLMAACAPADQKPTAVLPAGMAYADEKEIFFIHTETSDEELAARLTTMMSSPVLLVPSLADAPDSALANVYVFENGLEGNGPLGFQLDVFDNPPGSPGYSPLRRLNVVTWLDASQARQLTSAAEVLSSQEAGEISIAQPGVVINMPFVVWDGGKR